MAQLNYYSLLKYSGIMAFILFTFSCKKDDIETKTENIEWMRVLQDTLEFSTDDATYEVRNGKVITDSYDNIYVYYYSLSSGNTIVSKHNREGSLIWKKAFDNCKPLDMARLNDGNILLAVSVSGQKPNYLTLYSIQPDGNTDTRSDTLKNLFYSCAEIENANIYPTAGSSFVISGVWNSFVSGSNFAFSSSEVFIARHSELQVKDWIQYLPFVCFNCPYTVVWPDGIKTGSSVAPISNGQYLFKFSTYSDGSNAPEGSNTLTGLLNADGAPDTSFVYNSGKYARYGNTLMQDYSGGYVSYYSTPREGAIVSQGVTAGFLRIGQDGKIKDTIPVAIPNNYRIVSCTKNAEGFLATAYKTGVANGGSDYSAAHTLFLRGGNDWTVTERFTLQQFYSDYFFSHASVTGGGMVSMGRIQSLDGPVNKLMLIKWKK
jgi:hypothetical protein